MSTLLPPFTCALLFALGACRTSYEDVSRDLARQALVDPRPAIVEKQRTFYDGDTSRPRQESTYRVFAGGRKVLHGPERAWYQDGVLRWEREYRDGEPCGRWASYYEDGTMQSESWPDVADATPRTTTWWHRNGKISSQGPTVRGARQGPWNSWYEDGTHASEGSYAGNLRDGPWTFWHPDGRVAERGAFSAGVKVGTWERDPK
jgi:hypothetical protein